MPEDFSDTEDLQRLDTPLSQILAELETLNVHQANIEHATLTSDRPLRYATGVPIFIEQWEYTDVRWNVTYSGAGASGSRITTNYMSKGACYQLRPGSDSGMSYIIWWNMGPYPLTQIGVQFALVIPDDVSMFRLFMEFPHNGDNYTSWIRWDMTNEKIQIYDDTLAWIDLDASWDFDTNDTAFHFAKLIVDHSTGMYVSLEFDEQVIDLSAYAIADIAGAAGDLWKTYFTVIGTSGNNPNLHLDNICITKED